MSGIEIELKLRLPPAQLASLRQWLRDEGARGGRLRARYVDTAERSLAAAGLALRLRHERGIWVQTLKAAGVGALDRQEHEVVLQRGAAANPPAIDPSRHGSDGSGGALAALLSDGSAPALRTVFETDIRRLSLPWRSRRGWVELSFDTGHILAPDRKPLTVSELEIELLRGSPLAVIEVARQIVHRHGAWVDPATKAERGYRLAAGEDTGTALRARPLRLDPHADPDEALAQVLAECRRHLVGNLARLAAEESHAPESVHQARVALRRLRSALRLFGSPRTHALDERARALAGALGLARERDVLIASIVPALAAAGAPSTDLATGTDARLEPRGIARARPSQLLVLDLLALEQELRSAPGASSPSSAPVIAVGAQLGATLAVWHRRVRRDARDFATLDDQGRHRLRRRMKRLRYGLEFCAALCGRQRYRRFIETLALAQEALGRYNDLVEAVGRYRAQAARQPQAWFAVGWLTAEATAQATRCADALAAFRSCPTPLKRQARRAAGEPATPSAAG
jgi:triphosphatase